MSSVRTQPAYVQYGTWNEESRKHPAMKWMEEYNLDFDSCNKNFSTKWYCKDWTLHKGDGQIVSGLEKCMNAPREIHGPMTTYFHEPHFVVCVEVDDVWEMIGEAKLFP